MSFSWARLISTAELKKGLVSDKVLNDYWSNQIITFEKLMYDYGRRHQ